VIITFHPAFLMRQPAQKKMAWIDLKMIREKKINLKINLPNIKFGIDTSIPLGLLLNEIISNSLKYAFDENIENPEIIVELFYDSKNDEYLLKVGDNGVGMPREIFEKNDLPSLGMELIKIFVQQLDGKINMTNDNGTMYYIRFKAH